MKLTIHLEKPGCGDGMYEIRARGYLAAELFWSNEKGILEEYTAFACIPLGPALGFWASACRTSSCLWASC